MPKLTLSDLSSLSNQTSAITLLNNNNTAIEAALEKTLSRDGTAPNAMEASLDMNSQRIINLPAPVADAEPVRKIDLDTVLFTTDAARTILSIDSVTELATTAIQSTRTVIHCKGYYEPGDGGEGYWKRTTEIIPVPSWYRQSEDGAYWKPLSLEKGQINVRQLGALMDNTTNDTSPIQSACDAVADTKGSVFLTTGIGLVSGITWRDGTEIYGASRDASVLKLLPNSNTYVITSENANALFGTGSTNGVRGGSLHDFTINGGWTKAGGGQTSGGGLAVYGEQFELYRLNIINCRQGFIKSEDGNGGTPMEASVSDLFLDHCGETGFIWNGPHDSDFRNIIMVDPGQETDNTYDGLSMSGVTNGRFWNIHIWHRGSSTNRARYAGNIVCDSSQFVACHFEGARRNLRLKGNYNTVTNCPIYANFSSNPMWIISGSHLRLDTFVTNLTALGYTAIPLQIGEGADSLYNSTLDLTLITSGSATAAISVVNDGGKNTGSISVDGVSVDFTGSALSSNTFFEIRPNALGYRYQTNTLGVRGTPDVAQFNALRLENNRATPAAFDSVNVGGFLKNASNALVEHGRLTMQSTSTTAGAENGRLLLGARISGTLTDLFVVDSTGIYPTTNNTRALGWSGGRFATVHTTSLTVGGLLWSTGTGSPEGVVTAPIGSLFTRTDGGASTTLYVKESGTGNTGWVAK